ncbi:MAG TPA: ATP-binding protein [Pyrinomonadaceae bacterium]|nr:ATP-binding protein [Pyrinomonadaceae bacterium]
MSIRLKIFLIFLACGVVPVLSLSLLSYWKGARSVEAVLRGDMERKVLVVKKNLEEALGEREAEVNALARIESVRAFLRATSAPLAANGNPASSSSGMSRIAHVDNAPAAADSASENELPAGVRADVSAFLQSKSGYFTSVTCLGANGSTRFCAKTGASGAGANDIPVYFRAEDLRLQSSETAGASDGQTTRSILTRDASGASVRYTVPVFSDDTEQHSAVGSLVVYQKLDQLLGEAADDEEIAPRERASGSTAAPRTILVLHNSGQILYHSNAAIHYQPVASAIPGFKPVADAMMRGESGEQAYEAADGDRWLVSYRPLGALDLSVAAAQDYTKAAGDVRSTFLLSVALSVISGLLLAVVLTMIVRRTARSLEHVTEGAVAIAKGDLDQRIEVRSDDETRLLADSVNLMTDKLREKIAHEAETRQFESFMRISAMLTHDLKNAIASLSLLVSNMERQFHREEFRVDAMNSVKAATDKLRAIVSKLSDPVETLSGEHKRPRPTDLVPMMRRVLASTADAARALHEIETRLPPSLVAAVDADRMEKIMENLVINALEAMGAQRGKLTIEAGNEDEQQVYFSVTDTGTGMTEEFQRTRLFHPFATTKRHGVGLGLYTCREIVRAHGGRIEVESKKGSGTTFRIVLPSEQIAMSKGRKSLVR